MDTKKIDLVVKIVTYISIAYFVYKLLDFLGVFKKSQKTDTYTERKNVMIDEGTNVLKNTIKPSKQIISTEKMKSYLVSYIKAFETGKVDLVIKYESQLKNIYDFSQFFKLLINSNLDYLKFNDWDKASQQKYFNHVNSFPAEWLKIGNELGAIYGNLVFKSFFN